MSLKTVTVDFLSPSSFQQYNLSPSWDSRGDIILQAGHVFVMEWTLIVWENSPRQLWTKRTGLRNHVWILSVFTCPLWCCGTGYTRLQIDWLIDIGIDHDTVCAGVVGTAIRHSTSCAGRGAVACSTNHSSADRISGQLLCYHDYTFIKRKETFSTSCTAVRHHRRLWNDAWRRDR